MDVSDYSNELQTYLLGHGDDLLAHIIQFNELMMRYQAAIKEVSTKLEIPEKRLSAAQPAQQHREHPVPAQKACQHSEKAEQPGD